MSALPRSRTRSKKSSSSAESVSLDDRRSNASENPAPTSRSTSSTSVKSNPASRDNPLQSALNSANATMAGQIPVEVTEVPVESLAANGVTITDSVAAPASQTSSLSDIGDGADEDNIENGSVRNGENDSEAETERLQITPQKPHKHVLVTPRSHHIIERSPSKLAQETSPEDVEGEELVEDRGDRDDHADISSESIEADDGDDPAQPEVIASRNPLAGEAHVSSPAELAGKKRKRSAKIIPVEDDVNEPMRKKTGSIKDSLNGESFPEPETTNQNEVDREDEAPEEVEDQVEASDSDLSSSGLSAESDNEADVKGDEDPTIETGPRRSKDRAIGKRDRHRSATPDDLEDVEEDTGITKEAPADLEEDAVEDEAGNTAEDETGVNIRDEEEVRKRNSAMDSLSTIEKHFAAFRDKLFDERSKQLAQESELIYREEPAHPDLIAMLQCLDERRDEKIELEQTKLQYKINGLKIKCVAEKSQIHSQYFQTVRDQRESIIENLSEQWYQIQKGRRGWEGRISDYMYNFPTRRSQQITQQTAYNAEVSLLAGVRKYVGFPAAPPIEGVRSSELDDDFKAMGNASQAQSRSNAFHHQSNATSLL